MLICHWIFTALAQCSAAETPASLPFYFLEPSDVCQASNIAFQPASAVQQPAPALLWPVPKDKPLCSYAPVSTATCRGVVRVWYQRIDSSESNQVTDRVLCYGELQDGQFTIPRLANQLSRWPQEPNVVMRRSPYRSSWGGFNVHQILSLSPGPPQCGPYAMLYWDQPEKGEAGGLLAFSQNGLDWNATNSSALFTEHNDAFTLLWNAQAREYWLYQTKLEDWPGKPYPDNLYKWRRVISLRRSLDLRNWTSQEVILRPDAEDPKAREFYLLKVFPYGPRFAGLLMRYEADPDRPRQHGSHSSTELILSDDGKNWRRPFRGVDLGFWSYADGFRLGTNLCFLTGGRSGLVLRRLRADGLVACGSPAEPDGATPEKGFVVTHLFKGPKRGLYLNVDARHGLIEAELLDEQNRPVAGFGSSQCRLEDIDGTHVPLRWQGKSLSDLKNRAVRLRLSIERARVYSLGED